MAKPGGDPSSGISLGDVLRLPKRHPAWRRREAQPDHNVVYSVGVTSTQVGLGRGSTFAARCKLGSTVATLAPKRTPYI